MGLFGPRTAIRGGETVCQRIGLRTGERTIPQEQRTTNSRFRRFAPVAIFYAGATYPGPDDTQRITSHIGASLRCRARGQTLLPARACRHFAQSWPPSNFPKLNIAGTATDTRNTRNPGPLSPRSQCREQDQPG